MNERTQSARASAGGVVLDGGANTVLIEGADRTHGASAKGICSAISFPSLLRSPCRDSASRAEPRTRIEYSITPDDVLRPVCGHCGHCGQARTATRHIAPRRDERLQLVRRTASGLPVAARISAGFEGGAVGRRASSRIRVLGAFCFLSAFAASFPDSVAAQPTQAAKAKAPATIEYSIFPKVRALSLAQVRALATTHSTRIALARAKLNGAQADLKEQRSRFKVNSAGGLDPLSGKVRFYLGLDLERLLQLNKEERNKARQEVEAHQIGQAETTNAAIKEATVAWYGLRKGEAGVLSAIRYRDTAQALYVAADARFRSGQGELSVVLTALDGTHKSNETFSAARQQVALDCLEIAQACGYATAEELEAAL